MKAHKSARIFFIAAAMSFLLSGCYPTGEVSINDNTSVSDNATENSEPSQSGETQEPEEIKNLTVAVELPESYPNEVNAIDLSVKRWDDDEAIKEMFIGGKTIAQTFMTPSDYYPGEFIQVYDTEDNWRMVLETGRVSFENKELLNKYSYGSFSSGFDEAYEEYGMPDSLEGFPKSEAIETVKAQLDKLGITNVSEPDTYAISCEWATEFLRKRNAEPDVDYTRWTKDDEIYVLVFPLKYENVPLATHSQPILGTDMYSPGTSIKAVVSKQGLISIDCAYLFEEKYEKGEIKPIKVDAKAALDLLISSYSKQVLVDPITINKCRLVYFPTAVGEEHVAYTYSPFWEFEILKGTTSIGTLKRYKYINAETGNGVENY